MTSKTRVIIISRPLEQPFTVRVSARDIASDRSPFSDGDVDSIREMADEVLALAKAAGFDQDVAA